jgi:pimeloyl-ACP methyl ester carboxylesterase
MLFPHYAITVAGHSLGGAIATLAAAQLRNLGYSVALFTFGSPRVGGAKLSAFISGQQGGNYRVTHWNDPVPRVPLLIMGYVHVSPEYYIGRKSGESVGEGDVRVFEGSVNFGGNAKWLLTDVEAHRWYFGSMYTCKSLEVRGEVVARF